MSEFQKNQFARLLRYYLLLNGKQQSDLCADLNFDKSTVSCWCNGTRVPKVDVIIEVADYLHVAPGDLLIENSCRSGVKINVFGRVAAGIPLNSPSQILDTEEISDQLAKTGEFFGLQIHGDSMEPRICEGDVVIVRQQPDAESGDIVIALVNGDDAICKRLRKYRDGIELISLNPSYEPMFFSDKDIIDKPVRIIGKVVELRGKF